MKTMFKKHLPNLVLVIVYGLIWASAVESNFDPERPELLRAPAPTRADQLKQFTNFLTNKPFSIMLVYCAVCGSTVDQKEIVKEAPYKNLPSPCCELCYNVRDDTDSTISTVAAKSLEKRKEIMAKLNPPTETN